MHEPPLYRDLPTPEEMALWDQQAHSLYGIPPLLLMANAAQAAFAVLRTLVPLCGTRNILIVMGKGNNGGDGAALARILHDEGHAVRVFATAPPEDLPSPAREHAAMALALGVPFRFMDAEEAGSASGTEQAEGLAAGMKPDIVVDALTGTGIRGELRPRELHLVRLVNSYRASAFIFSLDIPSGLCGLTGKAMPEAVRAHATVCFEAGKPGLFMPEAQAYTGKLEIRRVGIPRALRKEIPPSWRLLAPRKGAWAVPSRFMHKGKAGTVLVIGGSEGMAGAPLLAALGSLRAGAGLVHAALPAALEPAMRSSWPEVLSHPFGTEGFWREQDAPGLLELIRRIMPDAVVVGPGMGRSPAVGVLLNALLEEKKRPPFILDADALFFMRLPEENGLKKPVPEAHPPAASLEDGADAVRLLKLLTSRDILTPHPGEMARLLPKSFYHARRVDPADAPQCIRAVQENRADALGCFTRACHAVLVLKGPGTLIGITGAPVTLAPFAVAALGVGGSGDVLAGICASLVAAGFNSLDAAGLGVYLHGRAGELLSERAGRGHLAREIAETVPSAWEELCSR